MYMYMYLSLDLITRTSQSVVICTGTFIYFIVKFEATYRQYEFRLIHLLFECILPFPNNFL